MNDIDNKNSTVAADTNESPNSSFGTAPVPPPADLGPAPQPKAKRQFLRWMVPVAVIIVVALAAYLLVKNHNDTSKVAVTTPTKKTIQLLRLGSDENFTDTFYPEAHSLDGQGGFDIHQNVYEGLVGWGTNSKLVPLLATSWTNPDSKTWVFKLHPNVKFHDGKTMTAQDVKSSLESDAPSTSLFGLTDVLDQVTIVDPATVKITTKQPDALLLDRLANVYIYDASNSHPTDTLNATGPYTLKPGTTANAEQIDLIAFKDYYGPKPMVQEIVGKNYSDADELTKAVKLGKADLAYQVSTANKQDILSSTKDFKFVEQRIVGAHSVQPDTLKPNSPVQKLPVRQAILAGLDAAAVLKASGGDGEVTGQLGPQTMTGYDPSLKPAKYDPGAAKKLLADAGYPNGLTLSIFHGPPTSDAVKEMASELKQVGVSLDDHTATSFNEFSDAQVHHLYDLYYSGNTSDIADLADIVASNFSKGGSFQTYENTQVDNLLAQSNQQFDATTRIKTLQQIQEKLVSDVAYMPTYIDTFQVVMRSNYYAPFVIPDGDFFSYFANLYQQ